MLFRQTCVGREFGGVYMYFGLSLAVFIRMYYLLQSVPIFKSGLAQVEFEDIYC